jgi:hypothetical protein
LDKWRAFIEFIIGKWLLSFRFADEVASGFDGCQVFLRSLKLRLTERCSAVLQVLSTIREYNRDILNSQ